MVRRVVERCAGLDVHKSEVTACVRQPGDGGERQEEIRTFATTTNQLLALRDWLAQAGVTRGGMESTGVYWKPVVRREALSYRVGCKTPPVTCRSRWPEAEGSVSGHEILPVGGHRISPRTANGIPRVRPWDLPGTRAA